MSSETPGGTNIGPYVIATPRNLHAFSPSCAEVERHRIFRDWLRSHPEDCWRYAAAKLAAAKATRAAGGHAMDYNARKELALRDIYNRAFGGLGLLA